MKKSSQPGHARRPAGLRLIIAYKVVKAPLMLALAVWLTASPASAYHLARAAIEELGEHGAALWRLARWLGAHVSRHMEREATLIAWADGLFTTFEAVCLLIGKPWGEWAVIVGLSALIPFEIEALARHPSVGKVVVLVLNVIIVAYLAARRISQHLRKQHRASPA